MGVKWRHFLLPRTRFIRRPLVLPLLAGLLIVGALGLALREGGRPDVPLRADRPAVEAAPAEPPAADSGRIPVTGSRNAAPGVAKAKPRLLTTGRSTQVRERVSRTRVLATSDEPWPQGTNALWCATVEMVWREFGEAILGEPIRLGDSTPMAERLSTAPPVSLAARHRWTGSGPREAPALQAASDSLRAKFPNALAVPPIGAGRGYFAIAYLEAAFRFGHAYQDLREPIRWQGKAAPHRGFGISEDAVGTLRQQRAQAALLFERLAGERGQRVPEAFALDLDRSSQPFQIILAVVPRARTLQDTWAAVAERIKARPSPNPRGLRRGDVLRVPSLDFDLEAEFGEVSNKRLANAGFADQSIAILYQRTTLRLDKAGVETKSIATFATRGTEKARVYAFDRPFLIALRERSAERPFLMLWVDNPELLMPAGSRNSGSQHAGRRRGSR
jgi:hypothetical protein